MIATVIQAIHLYRESEQRRWKPHNDAVIQRVRDVSFPKVGLNWIFL